MEHSKNCVQKNVQRRVKCKVIAQIAFWAPDSLPGLIDIFKITEQKAFVVNYVFAFGLLEKDNSYCVNGVKK